MPARIGTALCTSALGITLANPADVVKVRTQASLHAKAAAGVAATPASASGQKPSGGGGQQAQAHAQAYQQRGPAVCQAIDAAGQRKLMSAAAARPVPPEGLYRGPAVRVYQHIVKTEGVFGGLYAGYVPNLLRNSIISASELVAYDTSKQAYAKHVPDGPMLHMMSGLTAGLIATLLGSPMDVVSTRIMVKKAHGDDAGMLDTIRDMFRREGLRSFYNGFVPNFARIGAFNVVLWMAYEQLHKRLM